ncbi:hypothetical protein AK830_g8152 [Neonectria ditissima]|uniref:Transcription factor domain-containing protein n=1 Tax=Neonectria ditissima TaxID=78410 RepID=A0A0P7AY48_9HYPO|nr:hypothetical protein AK830_g8152 [Neonectria ditissima]
MGKRRLSGEPARAQPRQLPHPAAFLFLPSPDIIVTVLLASSSVRQLWDQPSEAPCLVCLAFPGQVFLALHHEGHHGLDAEAAESLSSRPTPFILPVPDRSNAVLMTSLARRDTDRPACSNCRKSDSDCVRGYSVRFRHGLNPSIRSGRVLETAKRDYQFAHDQPWVKTNRALSFVDETPDVINIHDDSTGNSNFNAVDDFILSPNLEAGSQTSSPRQPSPSPLYEKPSSEPGRAELDAISPAAGGSGHPNKKRALSQSAVASWRATFRSDASQGRTPSRDSQTIPEEADTFNSYTESPLSGRNFPFIFQSDPTVPDLDSPQPPKHSPLGDCVADAISGIYLETPRWPLEDPIEAMLFQTFVNNLAPLFDLCDSDRHFATVVPRRAVMCPPLMNAVLAGSAKRLSRISDFDALVGDRYHQKCLDVLIPALSSSAAVMDENLLTAIVILRYMEELDVPIMSSATASESHLMGTRVFIAAQDKLSEFASLRRAAFWVALRQEIHMAFIQARPVHPNFDLESISRLVVPDENGCSFANLTILHCAACLRYCYGAEEHSTNTWEKLRASQDRWWVERPWYFHPMYINEQSDAVFPQVTYLNDAVVTGVLHYYLVQVLLAAHNPKAPRLGPGQAIAFRATNEEIKKNVRMVCGVAESNPRTITSYAYVCLAITMAGDRFTDPQEQTALYNILVKIDTQYAWPTGST